MILRIRGRFGDGDGGISRWWHDKLVRYANHQKGSSVLFFVGEDEKYLYIADQDGQLQAFNRQTAEIFVDSSWLQEKYGGKGVFSRFNDVAGLIWLGTKNGLFKLHPNYVKHYDTYSFYGAGLSDNQIATVYQDEEGIVWAGTNNGLNRLDLRKKTCTIYKHDPHESNTLSDRKINSIVGDKDFLWVATGSGINVFDKASGTVIARSSEVNDQSIYKLQEIFRRIHTFKGEFAQFEMVKTTMSLHEMENMVQTTLLSMLENPLLNNIPKEFVTELAAALQECIYEDMNVLISLLGSNFFANDEILKVKKKDLLAVEQAIAVLISPENQQKIVEIFGTLKRKNIKIMLSQYIDYVGRLGDSLGKVVNMVIDGDDVLLDVDRYYEFTRVLCHVFRNALDHGIESMEERISRGKEPCATIYCQIDKVEGNLRLQIEDDGAGVNVQLVKQKAVEKGLLSLTEVEELSETEVLQLLFQERFSTKEGIDLLSGRGAGLAAVKEVVEEMGGWIEVRTQAGFGTTFLIELPLG